MAASYLLLVMHRTCGVKYAFPISNVCVSTNVATVYVCANVQFTGAENTVVLYLQPLRKYMIKVCIQVGNNRVHFLVL